MTDDLCEGCHYLLSGKSSPTVLDWCGWMGGDPQPGNPKRCRPMPKSAGPPAGSALAKSLRIVPIGELAAENEAFADATGRLD